MIYSSSCCRVDPIKIYTIYHMFPGLDLYHADAAQPLVTTGEELGDLSDLSVRGVQCCDHRRFMIRKARLFRLLFLWTPGIIRYIIGVYITAHFRHNVSSTNALQPRSAIYVRTQYLWIRCALYSSDVLCAVLVGYLVHY